MLQTFEGSLPLLLQLLLLLLLSPATTATVTSKTPAFATVPLSYYAGFDTTTTSSGTLLLFSWIIVMLTATMVTGVL